MPASHQQDALRPVYKAKFLEAYAKTGVLGPALKAAGISRSSYKKWRKDDEEFDEACDDALQTAVDEGELALRTRGIDGVEEPVLYKGEPIWKRDPVTGQVMLDDDFNPIPYTIMTRSDRLLEVYTRAHRPEYSEKRSVELSGPGGKAIESAVTVTYVLPKGKTPEDYANDGQPADDVDFDPLED
jgi:hypothetical protein